MSKEEINNPEKIDLYTAVVYTDGSCGNRFGGRQNPAYTGSGVHGFLFKDEDVGVASKDNPNGGFVITVEGYIEADLAKRAPKVTPSHYIDAFYSEEGFATNNVAEIKAITTTIKHLLNSDLKFKKFIFKSDSSYTILIFNETIHGSPTDIELKPNGNLWVLIKEQVEELSKRGIEIELVKVKGHTNILGNIITDNLANMGRHTTENGIYGEFFYMLPYKKYWKPNIKKDHFLNVKSLLFNHADREKNPYRYVIMEYPSDKEIGTNEKSALFGLLYTKGQFEEIEKILDLDKKIVDGHHTLSELNMKTYYSQEHMLYKDLFKDNCYVVNKYGNGIKVMGNDLTHSTLQGLATVAFNRTLELESTYKNYIEFTNGKLNPDREIINITNLAYKQNDKGKQICHLDQKETYLNYLHNVNGKEVKIILSLNSELPGRNILKNLEKEVTGIFLEVVKKDKILQTNVIVVTEDVIGVYTNFFTRNVLL